MKWGCAINRMGKQRAGARAFLPFDFFLPTCVSRATQRHAAKKKSSGYTQCVI